MNFLLVVIILSVFVSGYTAAVAGVYEDSRKGGSFYICADDTSANGLYSEFGLAVGSLSNNEWNGTWYEGGIGDCLTGSFNIKFSGSSYSGSYTCAGATTSVKWSGSKTSNANVTDKECGKLIGSTNSSSPNGKWSASSVDGISQVDFCSDKDTFEASYFRPSNIPLGYDTGDLYRRQTVGVGAFYRSNKNGAYPGSSLWFINSDGDLANIWWAGHYDYLNLYMINDTVIHSYDIYSFRSGTNEDQCSRFEPIEDEPYDYYPYAYELFYFRETSASSTLVASLFLSVLFFLF